MIKSRRMRWTGHAARMESRGVHTWFPWEDQKEKDHLEDNIKINLREIA
jgi:hypothetical protein